MSRVTFLVLEYLLVRFIPDIFGVNSQKLNYYHVNNLDKLVDEFTDSEVTILKFSNCTTYQPNLSVPTILITNLTSYNFNGPRRIRRKSFTIALLALFPELTFDLLPGMQPFYLHYFPYPKTQMGFYILVFLSPTTSMTVRDDFPKIVNLDMPNIFSQSFFQMQKANGSKSLTIANFTLAVRRIPHRDSIFFISMNKSCADVNSISSCRHSIDLAMASYLGNFSIDGQGYKGDDFTKLIMNVNSSILEAKGFYRFKDVVQRHFQSPIRSWKLLKFFAIKHITTLMGMEALDLWFYIGKDNVTAEDVLPLMTRFFSFSNKRPYYRINHLNLNVIGSTPIGYDDIRVGTSLIITGNQWFTFATCQGVGNYVTFRFFTNPYDYVVWTVYACFIFFVLPGLLFLFVKCSVYAPRLEENLTFFVQILYFNLAMTFDLGEKLPQLLRKFEKASKLAMQVIGCWSLMMIILVSAYKGIVTSELMSRTPVAHEIRFLSQTSGFVFYVPGDFITRLMVLHQQAHELVHKIGLRVYQMVAMNTCLCYPVLAKSLPKLCNWAPWQEKFHKCSKVIQNLTELKYKLLSKRPAGFCEHNVGEDVIEDLVKRVKRNDSIPFREDKYGYCDRAFAVDHYPKAPGQLLSPIPFTQAVVTLAPGQNKTKDKSYFEGIYRRISRCKKMAYIDTPKQLDLLISVAETVKGSPTFRKADEKLFANWDGYVIYHFHNGATAVHRRLQLLQEVGIYQIWSKWSEILRLDPGTTLRKELPIAERVVALTMSSNVQTIFYGSIGCLIIATIVFVIERFRASYWRI